MNFFSSNYVIHFIILLLLLLHTKAISPQIDGKFLEVARMLHSSSSQKPRICQIYSKITGQHVQILNRKVKASGRENPKSVKVEIKSYTFGVVTLKGVQSGKYLCMTKKGKLVARRKVVGDGSCRFNEGMAPNYYTTYKNSKHPNWFIGFYKRGTPKRGKKTGKTQDGSQFILRKCDTPRRSTHNNTDMLYEFIRKRCKTFPTLSSHCQRPRNKRIRRDKTTIAYAEQHPKFLNTPPEDGESSLESSKWVNRASNFFKHISNFGSDVVDFDVENRVKCKNRRRMCRRARKKNEGKGKRGKQLNSSTLTTRSPPGVTTVSTALLNREVTAFPQTPLLNLNSELDTRETQTSSTPSRDGAEVTPSVNSLTEENLSLHSVSLNLTDNDYNNLRTPGLSSQKKATKSKRKRKRKKLRNRNSKVTMSPRIP